MFLNIWPEAPGCEIRLTTLYAGKCYIEAIRRVLGMFLNMCLLNIFTSDVPLK